MTAPATPFDLAVCSEMIFLDLPIEERARRIHERGFLAGMLAELPRKNCWTIAEHAGDTSPHGMQHFLNRAVWDTDEVAADLRGYVIDHLGEPDGVLIVDETGDLKKGEQTVGVQRQYTGTAGRIENAQVAVSTSPTPPGPGTR